MMNDSRLLLFIMETKNLRNDVQFSFKSSLSRRTESVCLVSRSAGHVGRYHEYVSALCSFDEREDDDSDEDCRTERAPGYSNVHSMESSRCRLVTGPAKAQAQGG